MAAFTTASPLFPSELAGGLRPEGHRHRLDRQDLRVIPHQRVIPHHSAVNPDGGHGDGESRVAEGLHAG
jgi:hypothetical protein